MMKAVFTVGDSEGSYPFIVEMDDDFELLLSVDLIETITESKIMENCTVYEICYPCPETHEAQTNLFIVWQEGYKFILQNPPKVRHIREEGMLMEGLERARRVAFDLASRAEELALLVRAEYPKMH